MDRELIARARRWAVNDGQNENVLTAVPRSFLTALADALEAALAREQAYREALKHARIAMNNYIQRADMDDAGIDCDVMPTDDDVETAIAEAFIHVSAALAEKP